MVVWDSCPPDASPSSQHFFGKKNEQGRSRGSPGLSGALGPSWVPLGAQLGRLGALLGGLMIRLWPIFGAPWAVVDGVETKKACISTLQVFSKLNGAMFPDRLTELL
eukprot:351087-Pyramimonas_sp.AAC.1